MPLKTCTHILVAALMASCGAADQAKHTPTAEAVQEDAELHSHAVDIRLNAGKKWAVNEAMKPHIELGRSALDAYIQEKNTDYQGLAQTLETHNQALIQSCTMTGKSHDELHKWLHPHMGLIGALSEARNEQKISKIIKDLEQSFQIYEDYFQ